MTLHPLLHNKIRVFTLPSLLLERESLLTSQRGSTAQKQHLHPIYNATDTQDSEEAARHNVPGRGYERRLKMMNNSWGPKP